MKKNLNMDESLVVQQFMVKIRYHKMTSIIMSKVFDEGNIQTHVSQNSENQDSLFLENLYLSVTSFSDSQDTYETEIFKFHQDLKNKFQKQDSHIELFQMIHLPNLLMLNTSSFEVFLKGNSFVSQSNGVEWAVQENFLALNGWSHMSRERHTIYKLIEILSTEAVD